MMLIWTYFVIIADLLGLKTALLIFQFRGPDSPKMWSIIHRCRICTYTEEHCNSSYQCLKCNGTQGNAVPPSTIYGPERSPTSDWQC